MFKINSSLRSTLLLGAATAAAVSLTSGAFAQNVETVVVTGSRIPQAGLVSASPVTAVGQQEMKFEGTTNVETLLNNLPATVADMTEAVANGATGTANVDLRGLGSSRTLVLIDGKRLMPADPGYPVADLNQIPAALVDHVEVLTGGASAVYGSDAEAGVVNFIMRKDFEGVELDGQMSIDEAGNDNTGLRTLQSNAGFAQAPEGWWGGRTNDVTLLFGANTPDGKGNVTGWIGYRGTQAVLQGKRDYSACSISTNKHDAHVCAGSSNKNRWISIDDYYAGTNYDWYEMGTGAPGSGTFVPYTGVPSQKFNYGAVNYIQRPDVRYIGGFEGHYQVDKMVDLYTSFMFSDDHTLAQIAPSGLFLGTGKAPGFPGYVEVNCTNPLMTAQENQILCGAMAGSVQNGGGVWLGNNNIVPGQALLEIGRRDFEGGNRIDDLRHTAYRFVLGAKGDLDSAWSYDAYAQYGITLYNETYDNEFSVQRVQNALQVDPATRKCQATLAGFDAACVPLDLFNGFGAITQPMLNYIMAQGFKEGYTEEDVVSGSMTGDLGEYGIQSPWAKDPINVAFGVEYRRETLELKTSRDFQTGDLYGQGGKTLPVPTSSFNVAEGFGEFRLPLVQGQEGFQDLEFNGGFRYSAYSTAGDVWAYKAGLQWQPIDDFRIRGSYERAVRAPNVLELFSPDNVVLFGGTDPCFHPANATVLANCVAHGAPNAATSIQQCPAAQCNVQAGGSLALKPEDSDTYSIGVVLTPSFFPGFTATVDWFSIKVDHYIAGPSANAILAACYGASANAASQAVACPMVAPFRSAVGHAIWGTGFVNGLTANTGGLSTRGIDMEANYQTDLNEIGLDGAGTLSLNMIGTYTDTLTTQPFPGLGKYDCAGLFGVTCGTPTPHWRHKLRVTWDTPWDVGVSLSWRHLSGVKLDLNTTNPLLNGACGQSHLPCPDLIDGTIGSYDYFDLAANWQVAQGLELRGGVNNLFDRSPPVLDSNNYGISGPAQFGNGNTYPGVYDAMGRTLFLAATVKY